VRAVASDAPVTIAVRPLISSDMSSAPHALDTDDGELRARIPVGAGAHGMLVWPQPGRYSLGHTGNMR
jgi:hypothetical protein